MAYIKIDETKRVTVASYNFHCGEGEIEVVIPDEIELKDIHDYKYINDEFIHEPLPVEEVVQQPTQLDMIEAQLTYTAMMTDTLLEV